MSKRRDIEANLHSLGELRDILNAMRNVARMEVQRLNRFLLTQQRVIAGIEAASSDFLMFHPELFHAECLDPHSDRHHARKAGESPREVWLLVGSERGFCGDFNESLVRALARHDGREQAQVVVLGSKLKGKLPRDFRAAAFLESASGVDEIEDVLVRLMNTLADLGSSGDLQATRSLQVIVFHHQVQHEDVEVSALHPFQKPAAASKRFGLPPQLYLDPATFARGLVQQYLFARLYELLYSSLMVENQLRIQHMDSAVERLSTKSAELLRQRNILRQEEITEEIEVIMLSAGNSSLVNTPASGATA